MRNITTLEGGKPREIDQPLLGDGLLDEPYRSGRPDQPGEPDRPNQPDESDRR